MADWFFTISYRFPFRGCPAQAR